jgi:hypothetical protein
VKVGTASRVTLLSQKQLLGVVIGLQAEVRDLSRRIDQLAKERTGAAVRTPARRLSLEEADRRGLLPRSARTVRKWLASSDLRAIYKPDIFVKRLGSRFEVDLAAIEEWRRAMTGSPAPAWPKSLGKVPS